MKWPWVNRREWEAKLDMWKFSYEKIERLYLQGRKDNGSLYRTNQKLLERLENDSK